MNCDQSPGNIFGNALVGDANAIVLGQFRLANDAVGHV